MMEVGRVNGSLAWNRAHFGAWCVVSAPLVLGLRTSTVFVVIFFILPEVVNVVILLLRLSFLLLSD